MATIHYRREDGYVGAQEGDILIDETGAKSRVVRDGRGLCLEPVRRGRPAGSGAGCTAVIPPQRVTPEQRATWDALGADWLRGQLDREAKRLARQRGSAPPSPAAD